MKVTTVEMRVEAAKEHNKWLQVQAVLMAARGMRTKVAEVEGDK